VAAMCSRREGTASRSRSNEQGTPSPRQSILSGVSQLESGPAVPRFASVWGCTRARPTSAMGTTSAPQ
jgi:hypothetical protein